MNGISRRFMLGAGAAATVGAIVPKGYAAPVDRKGKPFEITIVTPRADVGDVAGMRDYFTSQRIPVNFTVIAAAHTGEIVRSIPAIRAAKPDLVMTVFTPATLNIAGRYDAADRSQYITDIPIVFSSVTDPVGSGIVPSLAKPGRNVTGTRHIAPIDVQLRTILAYRPIKTLAIVYDPAESNMVLTAQQLKAACAEKQITLIEKPLPRKADGPPDPTAIPALIAAASQEGAQMLYIGPDTLVGSQNNQVVAAAALANKLPTFCATELPIRKADLMMGLVSVAINVGRFAGYKASEILLDGKSPADIPIETLNRFSLILRIAVARQLDLYPPMRLLNIAEVIQG